MSNTCAIITAARMGLRHNIMKPLLALNGSTVVKNAVETLRQAGCSPLIVVSGRNSGDLIRHLGRREIIHVINTDFNKTDMFHSFVLGLVEVPNEAKLIYFLPADVPLMNSGSLLAMEEYMGSHPECHILRPSRKGSVGHPVLMRREAADFMLSWQGHGGLREAMAEYPGVCSLLELDDEGMQLDVDRSEDFECFLAYAEAQAHLRPVSCRADIILGRDKPFFSSLLASLLRLIDVTGSLANACSALGISYSNGWKSIKAAEIQFGFELLDSSRGGRGGGVSRLTDQAQELLLRYDRLELQINQMCSESLRDYFHDMV
ncbi:MAG: NTP transferase domain-containing protein [Firmicutes bacterium]|nr:NTP transferase domain-containing protein [Bacillota bacterium]